jgi:hypothetical protein
MRYFVKFTITFQISMSLRLGWTLESHPASLGASQTIAPGVQEEANSPVNFAHWRSVLLTIPTSYAASNISRCRTSTPTSHLLIPTSISAKRGISHSRHADTVVSPIPRLLGYKSLSRWTNTASQLWINVLLKSATKIKSSSVLDSTSSSSSRRYGFGRLGSMS